MQQPTGCLYQDRMIAATDELIVGGVDALIEGFREVDGTATTAWTLEPAKAQLDIVFDFGTAAIRTPTGEPGSRQACPELLRYPFDMQLQIERGPTFRFEGTGETPFPAFDLLISVASSSDVRGEVPDTLADRALQPWVRFNVEGMAEGEIRTQWPPESEVIVTFKF